MDTSCHLKSKSIFIILAHSTESCEEEDTATEYAAAVDLEHLSDGGKRPEDVDQDAQQACIPTRTKARDPSSRHSNSMKC